MRQVIVGTLALDSMLSEGGVGVRMLHFSTAATSFLLNWDLHLGQLELAAIGELDGIGTSGVPIWAIGVRWIAQIVRPKLRGCQDTWVPDLPELLQTLNDGEGTVTVGLKAFAFEASLLGSWIDPHGVKAADTFHAAFLVERGDGTVRLGWGHWGAWGP